MWSQEFLRHRLCMSTVGRIATHTVDAADTKSERLAWSMIAEAADPFGAVKCSGVEIHQNEETIHAIVSQLTESRPDWEYLQLFADGPVTSALRNPDRIFVDIDGTADQTMYLLTKHAARRLVEDAAATLSDLTGYHYNH